MEIKFELYDVWGMPILKDFIHAVTNRCYGQFTKGPEQEKKKALMSSGFNFPELLKHHIWCCRRNGIFRISVDDIEKLSIDEQYDYCKRASAWMTNRFLEIMPAMAPASNLMQYRLNTSVYAEPGDQSAERCSGRTFIITTNFYELALTNKGKPTESSRK